MYLETSQGETGNSARLASTFAPPGKYCISFWFHMFGQTIGSLNVYLQRNESALDLPVWTRTSSSGNRWREAYVDVVDIYTFRVVYEAVRGSSYTGDIAIDDVGMTEGECPGTQACDFQHDDICGYQQELTRDDFDWKQGSGSTLSAGTGPTTDHTYGTTYGKYVYIDSSEQNPSDRAQLYTKITDPDPSGFACWKFYYHMNGVGVDTLRILSDIDGTQTELLTLVGNRGNKWFSTHAEVEALSRYRVVFEASVGNTKETGDIAIDDVDFRGGVCGHELSCTFESDLCLWENVAYGDSSDWQRISGLTVTSTTGPNVDHTTATESDQGAR
ncbi:MAM and LDL-receptor class A domain-containing protein 1-like [Lytechinus variegatus]|uniref:MAM and LDL-receptor class A domain-containing protein 1-like n=1 Tax=Lytechinus variegatus TaxID=7654 RepID=UPI001BB13E1E|nr:MAM and LDL-receptor class A domain-containing protein 1-like [Lytechinus variegatus]